MPPSPFSPEVISAVTEHMNDDHPEDTLLICRALGEEPDATAARMTGLDAEAGEYVVTVGSDQRAVRIPWSRPLSERPQIRAEVVGLYRRACRELGLTPREEH